MYFHGFPILEPWGWVSAIVSIVVSVILISVFVRIILRIVRGERWHDRRYGYCGANEPQTSAARTILDERYAKGEISEEEYRRMRDNLR